MSHSSCPPEGFASLIDITWAGFFVEQATQPATNTQAAVQAQLASAITWLGYANARFQTGQIAIPKYASTFACLSSEVGDVVTLLTTTSANVPIETDPTFAAYKAVTINNTQGSVGALYQDTNCLFNKLCSGGGCCQKSGKCKRKEKKKHHSDSSDSE